MPVGSGDAWAEDYERGRPGWPREVVTLPDVPATATVLDLGAGSGKLTRLLVPAFNRVIAVEPADVMRRILGRICPRAELLSGTGQEIPVADASVDAVFAAQAFHWFDDDHAVAEIARVLRPGGVLVVMWNLPAGPWEPSTAGAEELLLSRIPRPNELSYDPLDLGQGSRYASDEWALTGSLFDPLRAARLPNPQTLDREGLVAYYASMGWLADLPDEQRVPLLAEMRSLLLGASYRRQWDTHLHWTRLAATQDAS
ncbi:MAG TPA: class I SAM-dependent methyltransferase [Gaiellaceae bacterium]|nr:class I SAM-dependent methyltransferase [Gaiellaceae bacterium]